MRRDRLLLVIFLCALLATGTFRLLRVRAYQHDLLGTWQHTTWFVGSTESYAADGTVRFTTISGDIFGADSSRSTRQGTYSFVGLLGNYLRITVGDRHTDYKIEQLSSDTLVMTQYAEQPPFVLHKIAP